MWLLYLEVFYFLFFEKKVFEKNFFDIKGIIGIIGFNLKIFLNYFYFLVIGFFRRNLYYYNVVYYIY